MENEDRTFEILGIEGSRLLLAKKDGTWTYEFKPWQLSYLTIATLENRQALGWNPLGMARFESSSGKLQFVEVLL
jgi:hypothetical protein